MLRLALVLLAISGIVALVMWVLPAERPKGDVPMPAQQLGSDEPVRYDAIVVRRVAAGELPPPQPLPQIQTLEQRIRSHREIYVNLYPDLGEVLGLDASTTSDLYDLLTKQGLQSAEGQSADEQDRMAEEKDAQLKRLLGERAFRRFESYREMPAARDVNRLNASLQEPDRIRGEALWRLVQLMHENSMHGDDGPAMPASFQTLPPEVEGSVRSQALIWHAKSEDHFRREQQWRQRIEAEAVSFLTPVQFEALKRSHAEAADSWRRSLEQMRAEMGLTPAVPEAPESLFHGIVRRRVPIQGEIEARLTLTVNGEAVHIEHAGPNRQRFGFQAGSGLWVDAIATLYDDGWLEMLLAYSETRRGKRRQLNQWVEIGSPTRRADGAPSPPHDSILERQTGRMVYEIQPTGITATALERQQ